MTSASGFAWFAREPELICGAEGRASFTEINRLPQLSSRAATKSAPRGTAPAETGRAAFAARSSCPNNLDAIGFQKTLNAGKKGEI